MFKGFISEVSIDVGKSAAIMINQLFQWWKSDVKRSNKIYRTNQELHEDLCGVLSIATIQRCKQKLIDKGYIEVSFDKGLNRVTHYSLTEKALLLLDVNKKDNANKHVSAKVTDNVSNSGTVVPHSSENKLKHAKNTLKTNVYNRNNASLHTAAENKRMKESFDEHGSKRENVKKGVPDALKFLLKKKDMCEHTDGSEIKKRSLSHKKKNEATVEQPTNVDTNVDNNWEYVVSIEKEMMSDLDIDDAYTQSFEATDEYISDNDYGDCDVAMMKAMSEEHSIDNHKQGVKLSFSDLMKKCFDRGFTDDQEKLYSMKMNQQHFVEDY